MTTVKDRIISTYFAGLCEVCGKPYKPRKGFAIHHVIYRKDEKTYRDFNTNRQYHVYLESIIEKRGSYEFALLCKSCHYTVTKLSQFKPEKLYRLVQMIPNGKTD